MTWQEMHVAKREQSQCNLKVETGEYSFATVFLGISLVGGHNVRMSTKGWETESHTQTENLTVKRTPTGAFHTTLKMDGNLMQPLNASQA